LRDHFAYLDSDWVAAFVAGNRRNYPVYAKLTDGTGNVSKTAYLHFELQPSAQGMQALPMVLVVPSPILECDTGPGAFIAETLRPA